jgi:hypothetical protein
MDGLKGRVMYKLIVQELTHFDSAHTESKPCRFIFEREIYPLHHRGSLGRLGRRHEILAAATPSHRRSRRAAAGAP